MWQECGATKKSQEHVKSKQSLDSRLRRALLAMWEIWDCYPQEGGRDCRKNYINYIESILSVLLSHLALEYTKDTWRTVFLKLFLK